MIIPSLFTLQCLITLLWFFLKPWRSLKSAINWSDWGCLSRRLRFWASFLYRFVWFVDSFTWILELLRKGLCLRFDQRDLIGWEMKIWVRFVRLSFFLKREMDVMCLMEIGFGMILILCMSLWTAHLWIKAFAALKMAALICYTLNGDGNLSFVTCPGSFSSLFFMFFVRLIWLWRIS